MFSRLAAASQGPCRELSDLTELLMVARADGDYFVRQILTARDRARGRDIPRPRVEACEEIYPRLSSGSTPAVAMYLGTMSNDEGLQNVDDDELGAP